MSKTGIRSIAAAVLAHLDNLQKSDRLHEPPCIVHSHAHVPTRLGTVAQRGIKDFLYLVSVIMVWAH